MKIPKITNRGFLNKEQLRFNAVCLSVSKEDGAVSLPLAKAIENFVMQGFWNAGAGYEQSTLDKIAGKETDSVR
jgi:hypothetical protein